MDRNEFIDKLQMVYVGDRNAFNEIIRVFDNLKGALQTHKILLKTNVEENQRLKERVEYLERSNNRREDTIMGLRDEITEQKDYENILNELENDIYSLYEDICNSNDTYCYRISHDEIIDRLEKINDKLNELKESDK